MVNEADLHSPINSVRSMRIIVVLAWSRLRRTRARAEALRFGLALVHASFATNRERSARSPKPTNKSKLIFSNARSLG